MAREKPTFRTAPWLGRGIAFPLRRNPSTGGMQTSVGTTDPTASLEFLGEQWTIREDKGDLSNHVREAMNHIILTTPGEHDTLPEFGSRSMFMVNRPNDDETQRVFEVYCEVAVERWEHRITVTAPDDFNWNATDYNRDQNVLGVVLSPQLIRSQVDGNLVAPFVTPREARAAEYPLGEVDANGHDWCSRYHGCEYFTNAQGVRVRRARRIRPIPPASDDLFHEVKLNDTWLLISWAVYGDIRWWWVIAQCAVQDAAERGESREAMDVTTQPESGLLLRCPSRARLLMQAAA